MIVNRDKLILEDYKEKVIEKRKIMMKFEKYNQNIKSKEAQLKEEFILDQGNALMLMPLDRGFDEFMKNLNLFLTEIIQELNL